MRTRGRLQCGEETAEGKKRKRKDSFNGNKLFGKFCCGSNLLLGSISCCCTLNPFKTVPSTIKDTTTVAETGSRSWGRAERALIVAHARHHVTAALSSNMAAPSSALRTLQLVQVERRVWAGGAGEIRSSDSEFRRLALLCGTA